VETKHRCKTVVILAFYFPPDNLAGGARPFRFYKYLPRFGYQTRVVTVAPQDEATTRRGDVRYVPHPKDRGALSCLAERVLRRFVAPNDDGICWFPYAAAAARSWIEHDGASLVLSTSPAVSTHLAAMRLKRRYGVKWIADFRDPLLGSPFRTGSRRFDAFLEPRIFRAADAVIANTDALEQTWLKRYPQQRQKISLLWNGFDPEDGIAAAPIPSRDHRVLTHTGDIYGQRHPGQLFASMQRLIERGAVEAANLRIRLVGRFLPEWLPEHAAAMRTLVDAGQVECSGEAVPRPQAIEALAGSDYLLLLDVCGPQAGLQVPSKTFEYLQIGRPVLTFTTRNSPLERILEHSGVRGVCIYDSDDAPDVDEKMTRFLQLPPDPVRASDWFWEHFDGLHQARQLAATIDALTGQTK
jgi:glycosyltransferase involved in cell wall biosynthesis